MHAVVRQREKGRTMEDHFLLLKFFWGEERRPATRAPLEYHLEKEKEQPNHLA
jgi:hypothetical protein